MTQTLKQIRKSDLSELPSEVVELIALGVYSLYTITGDSLIFLMTTNTNEKWILMQDGAPLIQVDNWTDWASVKQACILIDG